MQKWLRRGEKTFTGLAKAFREGIKSFATPAKSFTGQAKSFTTRTKSFRTPIKSFVGCIKSFLTPIKSFTVQCFWGVYEDFRVWRGFGAIFGGGQAWSGMKEGFAG